MKTCIADLRRCVVRFFEVTNEQHEKDVETLMEERQAIEAGHIDADLRKRADAAAVRLGLDL